MRAQRVSCKCLFLKKKEEEEEVEDKAIYTRAEAGWGINAASKVCKSIFCKITGKRIDELKKSGIYVWSNLKEPKWVYVGQGESIYNRTRKHINNAFCKNGKDEGLSIPLRTCKAETWTIEVFYHSRESLDKEEIIEILKRKSLLPHGLNQEIVFKEWGWLNLVSTHSDGSFL